MTANSREQAIALLKLCGVDKPTNYQVAMMILYGKVAEERNV